MLSPAPTTLHISSRHIFLIQTHSRSKLLNLTGFFSSAGGAPMPVAALILWDQLSMDAGPDQGKRVLRRWGYVGRDERKGECRHKKCEWAQAARTVSKRWRAPLRSRVFWDWLNPGALSTPELELSVGRGFTALFPEHY